MPVGYQLVPEHRFPHRMVQINDNTEVTQTFSTASDDRTTLLFVFTSPKGRDNKVITITNGAAGFVEEFGLGSFGLYGQPLLNAYRAAASGAARIHCMRVTADDASYSNVTIVAKWKVVDKAPAEGETAVKTLQVAFYAKGSDDELTNLDDMDTLINVDATEGDDGWTSVPLFTVAALGKGTYGRNFRIRLTTDRTSDKENPFKNYLFAVYTNENGLSQKEQFNVVFDEDAVYSGTALFTDDVVNDLTNGSTRIKVMTNVAGFKELYNAYVTAQPDTTVAYSEFDFFTGLDKVSRTPLVGMEVLGEADADTAAAPEEGETLVSLSSTTGVSLEGGTEGALDPNTPAVEGKTAAETRSAVLEQLYLNAFTGKTDPMIRSKNRFPTNFMLDANYPVPVKLAMAQLATQRGDCVAMLDCGTDIATKASVKNYVETNIGRTLDSRLITIEAYAGKIREPFSNKVVTVTGTWWLANTYPQQIYNNGGKHRPLAGNTYGIMTGFLPNTVYPLFDEDLDAATMDELAELHINFAKYNPSQTVVRATQDTYQLKQTALSEQNNVLILLDIKRDFELMCAGYEYDFTDPSDIAKFNTDAGQITEKYASAQVTSISANFSQNSWERERNILHLNVEMVHKGLVRTTIIEIDVNKAS